MTARTRGVRPICRPFRIEDFLNCSGTLYVIAPADRQALFAPLVVGLIDQIRRAAYGTPGARLLFALDELANIAPLHDLPALLSEGGSQGVQILGCLQDGSQARQRWGGSADGFPTLFRHKVLLGGVLDRTLLESLSAVLGDEELPAAGASVTRPRWPPHALATPPPGYAVHIDQATAMHVAIVRTHDLTPGTTR